MIELLFKPKKPAAERLLVMREQAGGNSEKHLRYHVLVSRYQKLLLRRYIYRRLREFN